MFVKLTQSFPVLPTSIPMQLGLQLPDYSSHMLSQCCKITILNQPIAIMPGGPTLRIPMVSNSTLVQPRDFARARRAMGRRSSPIRSPRIEPSLSQGSRAREWYDQWENPWKLYLYNYKWVYRPN